MTDTPTPGQPLSEADVSLLQPGDWLLHLPTARPSTFIGMTATGRGTPLIKNSGGSDFTARFTFLGRPDQDGWIAWHGGENPVPGVKVEVRLRSGDEFTGSDVNAEGTWRHIWGEGEIIAYRPHVPTSSSSVVQGDASGVEREIERFRQMVEEKLAVAMRADHADALFPMDADQAAAYHHTRADLLGWVLDMLPSVDGHISALRPQPSGETREVDRTFAGEAVRDLAKQVELSGPHAGMIAIPLWAAKDILALIRPAPVALTPPAEPVSRPAGEGEAVARQIQALLAIKNPSHPVPGLARELLQRAAALLSPAAPDAGGGDERMRNALEAERDWHEMRADYAFDAAREHSARGEKSDEKAAMNRHNLHMQRYDAINRALQPGGER